MTTGIVIIALGDRYYMDVALNLAISIKCNSTVSIHLVHDGGFYRLKEQHKKYFDSVTELYTDEPFRVKTNLYDLSPYDRTLYLDADTIILPGADVDGFIQKLSGTDFAIINEKCKTDNNIWAEAKEIRETTGNTTDAFLHFFSELIYFEKNAGTELLFREIKNAYMYSKIHYRAIAGQMPDELAFTIGCMKLKVMPGFIEWCPLFWHMRNKKDTGLQTYQLVKKYIGYSIGGNDLPAYVKASYDNLVGYYERKEKLKGLTRAASKKIIFRNRIKL